MTRRKKLEKPSEILKIYSEKLSQGFENRLSPMSFEVNFSFRSLRTAFLTGFVVFRNGWMLKFDEIIQQQSNQVVRLKYRYHVMDKDKQLIFRYDNVAHFPKIKTHPHHKHLPNKVEQSSNPNLIDVIEEIELKIIKSINR